MSKTNMTMKMLVSGMAAFSESEKRGKSIGFTPKAIGNKMLTGFSGDAYLTTASDGRFVVRIRKRDRSRSHVIKRMNHGCLTRTKDDAILLTIKIFHPDEHDVAKILVNESWEAAAAYNELIAN